MIRSLLSQWLTKANPVARALVVYLSRGAIWPQWKDNAYNLAEGGYRANGTVYACVNLIARSAASVPWVLQQVPQGRGGKPVAVEQHPLLDRLNAPNPLQSRAAFIEAVTAYLYIAGNSYLYAVPPNNELWPLRPDRMTVLPASPQEALQQGTIVRGYEYTVQGRGVPLDADQVLHRKLFHPTDDFYGLSPIAVAMRSITAANDAQAWNVALLQNSARPSGALVAEGSLSDTQYDRLKAQMQESYQGADNAGRPLLLEGGIDWKRIALTPAELDWLQGLQMAKQDIAMVFQVPSELIGDSSRRTFRNFAEARKSFYEEVILPYLDSLRDDFNAWLIPRFGDRLRLDYDRDQVPALRESQDSLWARITAADFLTLNEKRQALGYEPLSQDVLLIPTSKVPTLEEELGLPDEPDNTLDEGGNDDD